MRASAPQTRSMGSLFGASLLAGALGFGLLWLNEKKKKELLEVKQTLVNTIKSTTALLPSPMPVALAADIPVFGLPGTNKERSFIAIKPDGVQRNLVGEIITRFESKGYKLVGIKVIVPTKQFAEKHYDDLKTKPFFPSLVEYFSSGPVVAMVWEGKDVITNGRKLIGATNPAAAESGSIRGDLCIQIGRNIIHGSDSVNAAKDEISLWFSPSEVANFTRDSDKWIYEKL